MPAVSKLKHQVKNVLKYFVNRIRRNSGRLQKAFMANELTIELLFDELQLLLDKLALLTVNSLRI